MIRDTGSYYFTPSSLQPTILILVFLRIDVYPVYHEQIDSSMWHILPLLRVVYANEAELPNAIENMEQGKTDCLGSTFSSCLNSRHTPGKFISERNENLVLRTLEAQIKRAIANYPTTIEEG